MPGAYRKEYDGRAGILKRLLQKQRSWWALLSAPTIQHKHMSTCRNQRGPDTCHLLTLQILHLPHSLHFKSALSSLAGLSPSECKSPPLEDKCKQTLVTPLHLSSTHIFGSLSRANPSNIFLARAHPKPGNVQTTPTGGSITANWLRNRGG